MVYIKQEPTSEPAFNVATSTNSAPYDEVREPEGHMAIKRLILEPKKQRPRKKSTKSAPSKKRKSKPINKKTKSQTELALLRYRLAFSVDKTSNEIAQLQRKYKDPTEKLLEKLYSRPANTNKLGDKYERRLNNRMSVLRQENVNPQQMRALRLDRGNIYGNRARMDNQNNSDIIRRRDLLIIATQNDAPGVEESKHEEEEQPGAFSRDPAQDYPPARANFDYLQSAVDAESFAQAESLQEHLNERIEEYIHQYFSMYGEGPSKRQLRYLKTPEDVEKKMIELLKISNKNEEQLNATEEALVVTLLANEIENELSEIELSKKEGLGPPSRVFNEDEDSDEDE